MYEVLVNGLHQYVIHLYKYFVANGYSDEEARSKAAEILVGEAEKLAPSYRSINSLLSDIKDESLRYQVMQALGMI